MPTQKRSGGVSITPSQVLNYRMSGTSTGKPEGVGRHKKTCQRQVLLEI